MTRTGGKETDRVVYAVQQLPPLLRTPYPNLRISRGLCCWSEFISQKSGAWFCRKQSSEGGTAVFRRPSPVCVSPASSSSHAQSKKEHVFNLFLRPTWPCGPTPDNTQLSCCLLTSTLSTKHWRASQRTPNFCANSELVVVSRMAPNSHRPTHPDIRDEPKRVVWLSSTYVVAGSFGIRDTGNIGDHRTRCSSRTRWKSHGVFFSSHMRIDIAAL